MNDNAITVTLTVNGQLVTRRVPVRQHLVDFLRTELGLTGSHLGCRAWYLWCLFSARRRFRGARLSDARGAS